MADNNQIKPGDTKIAAAHNRVNIPVDDSSTMHVVEATNEPQQTNGDTVQANEMTIEIEKKKERLSKSFWKNIFIISFAFLFLFMGYYPVSAVQSSLNNQQGVGMAALSAKYGSMAFGNLFTNNYVVDRVGCKWAMTIGMFLYSMYIAANFYPVFATLVPFGILSGVGGAAMWMAQGTYVTRICNDYVTVLNPGWSEDEKTAQLAQIKARSFAIFNFLYFASNGLGNAASSLILPLSGDSNSSDVQQRLQHCGARYCNENLDDIGKDYDNCTNRNSFQSCTTSLGSSIIPDKTHVYILCAFCITSAMLGVALLLVFLDRLPSLGVSERVTNSDSIFKLILATVRQWRNPYQILLIPLGLYNGMDNTFWSAEFTKAFVTCAVGIHYVGFVMVCYGLSSPIFIFLFSWFNKTKFRFVPFLIGLVTQMAILITILLWMPTSNSLAILFSMSVIWGIGSGVWYPSTYAFISIIFRENMEAAFSNFHLWNNLGSAINYAWSYELCVNVKTILLMIIVTIGVMGHLIVELHLHLTSKKKSKRVTVT